ncbi:MAG: FecR domain-containing protein [Cyclobacteriaceae bacterium]
MKNYSEIEDFVTDEVFQKWILLADEESEKYWNKFLFDHPSKKELVAEAKKLLLSLEIIYEQPFSVQESRDIWKDIQNETSTTETAGSNSPSPDSGPYFVHSILKYAAIFVVAFGLGWSMLLLNQGDVDHQTGQITLIEKVTPLGVKSQIKLSDGTMVWLNSGTSLSYKEYFSDSQRVVKLDGEAYFQVAKDKQRPFRVISSNFTTTALGTAFNVKSYKGEIETISLLEGKVEVTHKNHEEAVVLLPGEQAKVANDQWLVSLFDELMVISWKDKIIRFNKTDFDEMISVLEKWYNVKFDIQNLHVARKKSLQATGTFENESLENVLNVLSHSMKFEFLIKDKLVTLKFN